MLGRSLASSGLNRSLATVSQTMKVITGLLTNHETLLKLARLGGAPEDERHPIVLDAFVKQLAMRILGEEMRIEEVGPAETYSSELLGALQAQGMNNPAGRLQVRVVALAQDQDVHELVLGREPAQAQYIPDPEAAFREVLWAVDHAEDLDALRRATARLDSLRKELPPDLVARLEGSSPRQHRIMELLPEEDRLASINRPVAERPVKEKYQEKAWSLIKHMDDPILRNQEITATYADLFLQDPDAFVWAGMAALASENVGLAMAFFNRGQSDLDALKVIPPEFLTPTIYDLSVPVESYAQDANQRRALFEKLVAALAEGNRLIFDDIAWQHLAYSDEGIEALRRAHREGGISDQVWAGWQKIDEGKQKLLQGDETAGRALIWQGSDAILYHEQNVVLPAMYEPTRESWGGIVSWALYSPIPDDPNPLFRDHVPGANIADSDPRWFWITEGILPAWKTLVTHNPRGVKKIMLEFRQRPIDYPYLPRLRVDGLISEGPPFLESGVPEHWETSK